MTWPEYLAGCCRIDGCLTRLTRQQAELLVLLLLADPAVWTSTAELIERRWPNPDNEWDYAEKFASMHASELRKLGVTIESVRYRGYRIPREARGRPERVRLAA